MKIIHNGTCYESIKDIPKNLECDFIEFDNQSVFTTLKFIGGEYLDLNSHLDRLFKSAETMRIKASITKTKLKKSLLSLELNEDSRIKLMLGTDFWAIKASQLLHTKRSVEREGITVIDTNNLKRDHPHAKYAWEYYPVFFEDLEKPETDYQEILMFDEDDYLLEGIISNVFAVIDDKIITPKDNILLGITREKIIQKSKDSGFIVEERAIHRDELKTASEIFITNAVKGVVPVKKWGSWKHLSFSVSEALNL